jgi:hypothetical protein
VITEQVLDELPIVSLPPAEDENNSLGLEDLAFSELI